MRLLSGRLMRSWWPAGFAGLVALFCVAAPVAAQINVSIGAPSVDIGIHFPGLPSLTLVSGSPVYYAPQADANFFFYDGMYWVYRDDNWYASSWYNGPWAAVDPDAVPDVVLQVPVRYYRRPPSYFRGWAANAPPRWGEHWGSGWEQKHSSWNQRDRSHTVRPAPVPAYQRQYSGKRYPTPEQQPALHSQNYKYQPHEPVVQQHYAQHAAPHQGQRAEQEKGQEHKK